jgi:hypothetical protein
VFAVHDTLTSPGPGPADARTLTGVEGAIESTGVATIGARQAVLDPDVSTALIQ